MLCMRRDPIAPGTRLLRQGLEALTLQVDMPLTSESFYGLIVLRCWANVLDVPIELHLTWLASGR